MTIKRQKIISTDFAKDYASIIGAILKLKPTTQKVLGYLAFKFDAEEIKLDQLVIDDIKEATGLSESTIYYSLRELQKHKIITRNKKYRARYGMNPDYSFGKDTRTLRFVLTIETQV